MLRALGLCSLLTLSACEGIAGERDLGADPSAHVEFDLTQDGDRNQFEATDLQYTGSVGPYALFLVTGPAPRLDGPLVRFAGGYAVLRGASTYFTGERNAPEVLLSLAGGAAADAQLVSLAQIAMHWSGCANAQDQWTARLSSDVPVERIGVAVTPAPPVGSLLLLRRVALSGEAPGQTTTDTSATVCCQSGTCALQ
jgi:hypothetical protein